MSNKPPRIVIPGLNRGAGIPAGYVLGRRRGSKQGPAELLDLNELQQLGLGTKAHTVRTGSTIASTAHSETTSLSTSVSTQISSVVSVNTAQSTSLSQISSSLSGAISTNVGQSTSLSQISSSLSGAISSTASLSTAVSTVISGSISAVNSSVSSLSTAVSTVISGSISSVNSRIDSLSAAGGGGGATTFLALTDTPDSYVGQAGKEVLVKGDETGLEFGTTTGTNQSTSLSQISASLSSEISSRISGDTSLSTVISGSISTVNSSITSLSTAVSTVDANQSTSISINLSKINSLSTAIAASGTSYEAGPITAPTTGDLATWDNQGTSSTSDGTGAMIILPQVDGLPHGRYKTAPATPYTIYCRVEIDYLSTAAITTAVIVYAGILFKDTAGDNERLTFGTYLEKIAGDEQDTQAALCQRYTGASPPVLSASPILKYNHRQWMWHKVANDGTTLTYSVSSDGKNWTQAGTETLAAFIDAAGSFGVFALASANATEATARFTYFSTTAPA